MVSTRPRVSDLIQGTITQDPDTGEELAPYDVIGGESGLDHLSIFLRGKERIWRYRIYVDDFCATADLPTLRKRLSDLKVPHPGSGEP